MDYKQLPLWNRKGTTQTGEVLLCDEQDYEKLSKYKYFMAMGKPHRKIEGTNKVVSIGRDVMEVKKTDNKSVCYADLSNVFDCRRSNFIFKKGKGGLVRKVTSKGTVWPNTFPIFKNYVYKNYVEKNAKDFHLRYKVPSEEFWELLDSTTDYRWSQKAIELKYQMDSPEHKKMTQDPLFRRLTPRFLEDLFDWKGDFVIGADLKKAPYKSPFVKEEPPQAEVKVEEVIYDEPQEEIPEKKFILEPEEFANKELVIPEERQAQVIDPMEALQNQVLALTKQLQEVQGVQPRVLPEEPRDDLMTLILKLKSKGATITF